MLHDIQGLPEHNEIAGLMSCSIGNSKSQLHKARMRLRELLQETLCGTRRGRSGRLRSRKRADRVRAMAQAADFPKVE